MRDHAILDLLVHAGRHDLLALELILAGVGTSLHDGFGACLADAGQLRKFRFGRAVQVQLADPAALSLAASFVALALLVASLALSFWLAALS